VTARVYAALECSVSQGEGMRNVVDDDLTRRGGNIGMCERERRQVN